jgi:hypothetical protein
MSGSTATKASISSRRDMAVPASAAGEHSLGLVRGAIHFRRPLRHDSDRHTLPTHKGRPWPWDARHAANRCLVDRRSPATPLRQCVAEHIQTLIANEGARAGEDMPDLRPFGTAERAAHGCEQWPRRLSRPRQFRHFRSARVDLRAVAHLTLWRLIAVDALLIRSRFGRGSDTCTTTICSADSSSFSVRKRTARTDDRVLCSWSTASFKRGVTSSTTCTGGQEGKGP